LPGTVFATSHFWEANANEAAGASGRTPARVAKISASAARAALAQTRADYRPDLERAVAIRMQAAL